MAELPPEKWDEMHIVQYDDSETRRVLRGALQDEDTRKRVEMLLASYDKYGMPVTMKFRAGHTPIWLSASHEVSAMMKTTNKLIFRCDLPRREYPFDVYWEELEWIEVDSALPSVV